MSLSFYASHVYIFYKKPGGADWSTCTGQTWLLCDWSKCPLKTLKGKRLIISTTDLTSCFNFNVWQSQGADGCFLAEKSEAFPVPSLRSAISKGSPVYKKAKKDRCPVIKTHFCQTTAVTLHKQNIAFPIIVYFTIKVEFRQSRALNVRLQQQNIFWGPSVRSSCCAALLSISSDWHNRKHIKRPTVYRGHSAVQVGASVGCIQTRSPP